MSPDGRSGIKSLRRFDSVVDLLAEESPLGVQAVADDLDVAKSTAHAYLSTMTDLGYVIKRPDGYSLSLKFLEYGIEERAERPIVEAASECIERLSEDTGEAVYLVVEENGLAVYLDYALGDRAVRTHARIGTRVRMHYLASGRAILANLPDERVAESWNSGASRRRRTERRRLPKSCSRNSKQSGSGDTLSMRGRPKSGRGQSPLP